MLKKFQPGFWGKYGKTFPAKIRGCLIANVNVGVSCFGVVFMLSRRSVLDVHD